MRRNLGGFAAAFALALALASPMPRHRVEAWSVVDRNDGDMPVMPGEMDLHDLAPT